MKKLSLILTLIIGIYIPQIVSAVTFDNPAGDFLLDLRRFNTPNTFAGLLVYIINIVLGIVTLVAVAFVIYGGFVYITARGDEEQASAGKKTLTNAIIGLVIVIISYTLVTAIVNALNNRV